MFTAVALVPLAIAGLFVGALGQANTAIQRIPAAVVNEDALITTKAADGTTQNVFAGRGLVTELTGPKSPGFSWTITNAKDAAAMLKNGQVDAVLTVPKDFSKSILSLQSPDPKVAKVSIKTDDAHSYLTGAILQAVGSGLASQFGSAITEQYIAGMYSSIGDLGSSLSKAADGATSLSGGATSLSSGLTTYTDGVSSLSGGLAQLKTGASGLTSLSNGVSQYTSGVSQLSATLSSINGALQASNADAQTKATLEAVVGGLAQSASGGETLSRQTSTAINGVQSGIASSASGAASLAAGGPSLVSGARSLSSGATSLASGLTTGAAAVPVSNAAAAKSAASVASNPVTVSVTRANQVSQFGRAISALLVPIGLWVGALAVFLVFRPVSRRTLASTAHSGRLLFSGLLRAAGITAIQALLLVALLHLSLGVAWSALPVTAVFSLLMAFAFTAFHYLLTVAFGSAGLIVSLFVLAIQLTATGGLYPIQLLAAPFQAISPLLPLSYGVAGVQGIIAGNSSGSVVASALFLLGFGIVSVLLSWAVIRRSRRSPFRRVVAAR